MHNRPDGGGGKLAITSKITTFPATIRSNLETGASLCEGVCRVMLQARANFNTKWTWILHPYANEGLQTCDCRSIQSSSLKTLLFVKVTEGKVQKFFCDFNAFHCAALRAETERKRRQSEGWQRTPKKDPTVCERPRRRNFCCVKICCQLTSHVANDAEVTVPSFFSHNYSIINHHVNIVLCCEQSVIVSLMVAGGNVAVLLPCLRGFRPQLNYRGKDNNKQILRYYGNIISFIQT